MSPSRLAPDDPIVSIYPLPLSAVLARREAIDARKLRKRLPRGHPYRILPLWVPYPIARLLSGSAASSRPRG